MISTLGNELARTVMTTVSTAFRPPLSVTVSVSRIGCALLNLVGAVHVVSFAAASSKAPGPSTQM